MKLIKKQISGITYFSIDNLSISLDVSKRYNINLWSEGTQKQGTYTKTLYFDDTLEEWRTRDCECSNKDKSLDFSIVIENNVLKSLETLKIYGIDNGGVHIFNEVYFELNEIGGGSSPTPTDLPIAYYETYDASKLIEGFLTYFNFGAGRGLWYKNQNGQIKKLFTVGEYPDGYFTDANVNIETNTLNIFREGRPILTYTPDLLTDRFDNYVKFTANENSSIEVITTGTVNVDLQYSFDGIQWETYTTALNNVKRGWTVLFRGNNPTGFNVDGDNFITFNLIGDISVSGNVMGLLDNGAGNTTEIPNSHCFYALFFNSTGITSVSKNFLPATSLAEACYNNMFYGCTQLTTAPKLPATNLAVTCYRGMFFRCYKLEKAPTLPATTLTTACYKNMFNNCSSLTQAPELPATTLAEGCYQGIFSGCNSLFSVKIAYTGNFADTTNAFNGWLGGVPSYGIIYYNGSDTATGRNAIPTGWQKVTF